MHAFKSILSKSTTFNNSKKEEPPLKDSSKNTSTLVEMNNEVILTRFA